jgi:hypothetical protein
MIPTTTIISLNSINQVVFVMHMQRVFYKVKQLFIYYLNKLQASKGCDNELRKDRDQNDTDDLIKRHAKKKAKLRGIPKFQHIIHGNTYGHFSVILQIRKTGHLIRFSWLSSVQKPEHHVKRCYFCLLAYVQPTHAAWNCYSIVK